MLTTAAAAALLGVSGKSVRTMARNRLLPSGRTPSGQMRYPEPAVRDRAESFRGDCAPAGPAPAVQEPHHREG